MKNLKRAGPGPGPNDSEANMMISNSPPLSHPKQSRTNSLAPSHGVHRSSCFKFAASRHMRSRVAKLSESADSDPGHHDDSDGYWYGDLRAEIRRSFIATTVGGKGPRSQGRHKTRVLVEAEPLGLRRHHMKENLTKNVGCSR